MMLLIGLTAILNGMADIMFGRKQTAARPEPPYCPCRSVDWNEALEQSTHDSSGVVN